MVISADAALAKFLDPVTLVIPPKQQLSNRVAMERDYSWNTDGKPVYSELRGERTDAKGAYFKLFAKTASKKANNFFYFSGDFGWHWDNKNDQVNTVRLTTK